MTASASRVLALHHDRVGSTDFALPALSSAGLDSLLRERAIQADACASTPLSLSVLWKQITGGCCRVADSFFTDSRCLVLTADSLEPALPLEGRRLKILEAILCGAGQKQIAIELGLAPSTIALNARLALEGLGASEKPSRAHPLLMLAARAACDGDRNVVGATTFVSLGDERLRVISVPRPDRRLVGTLPPAELSVVRSLVEGHCYVEIARRRGTSTRTIANQIAAVFRRMRVSGRSELLLQLFRADGLGSAGPTLAPSAASRPAREARGDSRISDVRRLGEPASVPTRALR